MTGMGVEEQVLAKLRERFPKLLLESASVRPGVGRIKIDRKDLVEICFYLKEELGYEHLSCISAVDWKDRYECVYHFTRYSDGSMFQVNAVIPHDDPHIESLCKFWRSATYPERESYDLMGIVFDHQPDLRRILLPPDYRFFPLRKDFPQEVDRQYISRRKLKTGGA